MFPLWLSVALRDVACMREKYNTVGVSVAYISPRNAMRSRNGNKPLQSPSLYSTKQPYATNLTIANVKTLSPDNCNSHSFSSDGHEFGGPSSGSATARVAYCWNVGVRSGLWGNRRRSGGPAYMWLCSVYTSVLQLCQQRATAAPTLACSSWLQTAASHAFHIRRLLLFQVFATRRYRSLYSNARGMF